MFLDALSSSQLTELEAFYDLEAADRAEAERVRVEQEGDV